MPEFDRHTRRYHVPLFTMTSAANKTITILNAGLTGAVAHTVSIISSDGTAGKYVYTAINTPDDTESIATTCRRFGADNGYMIEDKCVITSFVLKTDSAANVTIDIELLGGCDMSGTTVA